MSPKFSRAREFEEWLKARGWIFVRNGGRHKIWRAPNGHTMPSSKGNYANRNIVANALRIERLPAIAPSVDGLTE